MASQTEKNVTVLGTFKIGVSKVSNIRFLFYFCIISSLILQGCYTSIFHTTKTYIKYPIKGGDTLYELSQRFSVSIRDIQKVNDIRDPRSLQVGSVLRIPYHGQDISRGSNELMTKPVSTSGLGSKPKPVGQYVALGLAKKYIGNLCFPVKDRSARLSSSFGRRWFSFHEGIDIASTEGVSVYAAHSGKVAYSGMGIRGYGNLIVLKGDNLMTIYGHNRRNRVRVGERVSKGERIADLGQTGKASGPHVHFETRIKEKNGKYVAVDPLVFFPNK